MTPWWWAPTSRAGGWREGGERVGWGDAAGGGGADEPVEVVALCRCDGHARAGGFGEKPVQPVAALADQKTAYAAALRAQRFEDRVTPIEQIQRCDCAARGHRSLRSLRPEGRKQSGKDPETPTG